MILLERAKIYYIFQIYQYTEQNRITASFFFTHEKASKRLEELKKQAEINGELAEDYQMFWTFDWQYDERTKTNIRIS